MLEQIIEFDIAALHFIQSFSFPLLDIIMQLATFLGNPVFWFFVVAFFYWKGKENESFHLMSIIVISAIFAGGLKNIFLRPRPSSSEFRVIGFDTYETLSFPSGHATLVMAKFFYVKNFIAKKAMPLFLIVVVLVAISRIYLGLHFLSDVIAGLVLGAVLGMAYHRLTKRLSHSRLHLTKSEDAAAIVIILIGAIFLVGFLQSIPLGATLVGYYLGFFSLKEIGLHERKLSKKKHALKQSIGFVVLGIVFASAILWPVAEILQFGLAGFWVSCLWPLIFEKVVRHD